ncbi:MAG TPA: CHAT domain-containing protein [Blastocatellia bacterium]|nr:CHAT domain-containing protein [Blastocatellia bacterium]
MSAVAEKYFALFAAEDLDGVMSLWSEKSPDYGSIKKDLQRQFATEDSSVSDFAVSRVKVENEKATLRATTNLTAVNLKSREKREQRIVRNFAFVREGGEWKVWRSAPAEDDLAEAMVRARTEAERADLLAGEKELVTVDLARALTRQGDRFANRGEYPQALAVYPLAISMAEQVGAQSEVANTLHNSGHVHRVQGNFAQAMECFQNSLAISKALGDRAGVGRMLLGIGLVHWLQGDFTKALEHYRESLTIFEALDNKYAIASLLNNIGNIHRYQADYAQALEYYRRGLKIHEELHNTDGILGSLGNIGVVYSAQGNFARALDYYRKSLAMSEAANDKQGIAITLGNIGVIHRKQGNYAQALDYYEKSLATSEAIYDKVGIAQMLNNIGTAHLQQRNFARALDYYRKSLAMREESGDKHGTSHTMLAIGVIHTSQGDYAQAQGYYQKSLAIKEAIGDRSGIAEVFLHIAIDHDKQGHYPQALDFAERAAALARQVGAPYILWSAQASAGLAYRALNRFDKARLAFEEAIAVIETMRVQVAGGGQEQQRFFEDKLSPYHAMADLLVAQNNPAEALEFAERARARALLDLLFSGRVDIVKAMTGQEREQERRLRSEIISLNTRVARAAQQDRPDQARLAELKSLREKVRLNYEAFQTTLYASHPELRVHRGEAPILKAEELAALLPDAATALLEYVVTVEKTYLFVVTKAAGKAEADIRVYTLPVKRDELAKHTEHFRGQLAGRDLGFRAAAARLYELLLKPAEPQLRGKTTLVIAPDDTLWDLPFQALLAGANRFLIEEAAIAYAPSLTVMREMMKRRKSPRADAASATLLALGNPLPGKESTDRANLVLRDERPDPLPEAEQEVKALSRLYGMSRSKVYTGAEAREDRVKSEASNASVLHFATHGTLNNASPMYSYLALAGGGTHEDGLLEAWELMQLDLKADLAVLSACETARGRIGAGEGMIGLSWAMFIAGVPSIVVSQWKVESAGTRDLMVNFHRALISQPGTGKAKPTKTEALRQAALKLMKNPETGHPFYWAGFVLVGDGR